MRLPEDWCARVFPWGSNNDQNYFRKLPSLKYLSIRDCGACRHCSAREVNVSVVAIQDPEVGYGRAGSADVPFNSLHVARTA